MMSEGILVLHSYYLCEILLCGLCQVVGGDLRDEEFVRRAVTGADSIVCCLGTTAFPSKRCFDSSVLALRS